MKTDDKKLSVDFECSENSFEEYYCPIPISLCLLKTKTLLEILALRKRRDWVGVSFRKEARFPLELTIMGDYTTHSRLCAEIKQFKLSEFFRDIPKMLPTAKLLMKTRFLKECIERLQGGYYSPVFMLSMNGETTSISKVGNAVIIPPEEMERIETVESSKALYHVYDFRKVVKAGSRLAKFVTLEYSTNGPMRISFRPDKFEGRLDYYLAPITF